MSKLAAICAKLQSGALGVNHDGSSLSVFSGPSNGPAKASGDDWPTDTSLVECSSSASLDSRKRKSSFLPSGGTSRRKASRPSIIAAGHHEDNVRMSSYQDAERETSMDGSEHSLHIDLQDDSSQEATGNERGGNPDLKRYTERAMTELLGLYDTTLESVGIKRGLASVSGTQFSGRKSDSNATFGERLTGQTLQSPTSFSDSSVNDNFKHSGVHRNGRSPNLSLSVESTKGKKCIDYTKYMRKFSNSSECQAANCVGLVYKEHYHCVDCNTRVFVKKEEMIRHYKWHKKRDESLQHGFMRYSPFDDCDSKFGSSCVHNKKQTHYHCIQPGCNKVYISTSDVQMHANYHRKASAIILEGFQRFRATEDCGLAHCDFYNQRTTHFHCRREGCNFTFKNKADMEKHKTYHQKDEVLSKDGFKKFMKYEHCQYSGCPYSKLSNHIHCIRPGCTYVLHSTSQLYSHKRKHEKRDFEQAYRKFKAVAPPLVSSITNDVPGLLAPLTHGSLGGEVEGLHSTVDRNPSLSPVGTAEGSVASPASQNCAVSAASSQSKRASLSKATMEADSSTSLLAEGAMGSSSETDATDQTFDKSLNLTPGSILEPAAMNWKTQRSPRLYQQAKSMMGHFKMQPCAYVSGNSSDSGKEKFGDLWKKYLTRYTANDPCNPHCWLLYKDHYHCNVPNCKDAFRSKDQVRDHARLHDNQEKISQQLFTAFTVDQDCGIGECTFNGKLAHVHCSWPACNKAIAISDSVFARLEHYREHENMTKMTQVKRPTHAVPGRKRGRPPKNSIMQLDAGVPDIPQTQGSMTEMYREFGKQDLCPDDLCVFRDEKHYHCTQARCHHVSNRLDVINLHSINFHAYVKIPEDYAYFDRNVNCRGAHCSNNRLSPHYHCLRPGCDYSFIRHTTIQQHDKRHNNDRHYVKIAIKAEPTMSQIANNTQYFSTTEEATNGIDKSGSGDASQKSHETPSVDMDLANQLTRLAGEALLHQSYNHFQDLITSNQKPDLQMAGDFNLRTVKATGTFFPESKPEHASHSSNASTEESFSSSHLAAGTPAEAEPSSVYSPNMVSTSAVAHSILPLMLFLQQKAAATAAPPESDAWQRLFQRMYASAEKPCGNVFCKKKQLEHYHCLDCGQAFNKSHESRVKTHVLRHNNIKAMTVNNQASATISKMLAAFAQQTKAPASAVSNELSQSSQDPNCVSSSSASVPSEDHPVAALRPILPSPEQPIPDQAPVKLAANPSPNNYKKFLKSEECGFSRCANSRSCDHYHCMRDDCGYSVNEVSRLSQHSQRHEKLGKIMGDDFKLYRMHSDCERADCEFSSKASHFHCLICPYICTDASRIQPHRKNHAKAGAAHQAHSD